MKTLAVMLIAATLPFGALAAVAPAKPDAPSGAYTLDKSHASLTFRVSHLGFSNYTAAFTKFDVALKLDTADPSKSSVTATVDPNSLQLPSPPPGFTEEIKGKNWLDAAQYKEIKFVSTKVEVTGANTAKIIGNFTLHGVTKPVVLDATFNGGYPGIPGMDPQARIGFSAKGVFKRSEFGIAAGVPGPGSNMGVSDNVDVIIEAEFNGPKLAGPGAAPK